MPASKNPRPSKKAKEEGGAVHGDLVRADLARPGRPARGQRRRADRHFKARWLNPAAFTIRVAIYFALWIGLAMVLAIGSRRQDATGSTDLAYGLNGLSAVGLVIYFLSVSFALIDWGMSLEPAWYSTLYGVS